MTDLSRWTTRAFYLGSVILVPFLKFLVWNEYGFLHWEVLVGLALLAVVSAMLAWAARGVAFYVASAACLMVVSTYTLQDSVPFLARVNPWLCGALVVAATAVAMLLMRRRVFPVIAVFVWSGLVVQGIASVTGGDHVHADSGKPPGAHVLWLVLDEHLGLDGFPACAECQAARQRLEATLAKYNFTLYTGAYSNYAATIDSVPSILNYRLLHRREELIAHAGTGQLRHYAVRQNRLFDDFHARGYRVVGFQHGSLRSCLDNGFADCRQYRDKLSWLHQAQSGWVERFRWVVGNYQASDPWLSRVKGFFPFRFGVKMTGPLSVSDLWPDELAHDIVEEPRKTLFFAHFLTPHLPYLYRRDGSVRPMREWDRDSADVRLDRQTYESRYERYCEQVESVAGKLDALFGFLDSHGALKQMTVVVHGDHGSRIRTVIEGRSGADGHPESWAMPEVWDYSQGPDERDLINRFSTLLAVKKAGASAPAWCHEKHSLLTLLARSVFGREPQDGVARADQVFLVGPQSHLVPIEMKNYWR